MEQQVIVVATDWALFGATLFLGFVALLVALIGPYIGDIFKRRFIAPRLHIEFRNESPYCHLTKLKSPDNEYYTYYFCFAVENRGKSAARSCEVVLEEVCTADDKNEFHPVKQFWPTNLMLQGNERVHINPGRPPIYVAIGHISEPICQKNCEPPYSIVSDRSDFHRFIFDFPIGQRLFFKIDSRSSGRHIFKVVIIGENFKPIRKQFELCWSGNWTEDEAQMLQKEAVLTMKEKEETNLMLKEKAKNEGESEPPSKDTRAQTKRSNHLGFGIMFLLFSLTLFGLPSPKGEVKAIAAIVLVISLLFMLSIIGTLIRSRFPNFFKFSSVSLLSNAVRLLLWGFGIVVYLTGFVISLGNNTAQMKQWNPLGSSAMTIIGLIWCYIIIAVLATGAMDLSNTQLSRRQLKSPRKRVVIWPLVATISLALIIGGIVLACTNKPLEGIEIVAAGVTFALAAVFKKELSRFAPF